MDIVSGVASIACSHFYISERVEPGSPCRLVVATTDPAGLPEKATRYLATNLPHPEAPHAATGPHPPADLAEIVRLYGLRPWSEQSYKQIKDELGWADFQVRSDRAIRRHQTLVNCAFSFCWDQWSAHPDRWIPPRRTRAPTRAREGDRPRPTSPNSLAGPGPYGPSVPGAPPPSPSTDGGEPGRTRTHPPNFRP
ncbi:hypothetical protein ACH4VM_36045 [Streptomyces sp. NPDC020792]|uniref:hypothetical protein n=1 Tax=Streptomyces sp. NPDC020792 TaxID=3365089 RepID=UPI00379AE65C